MRCARPHAARVFYLGITVGQNRTASDRPPATANVRNDCLAGLNVKISGLSPIRAPGNPRIAKGHTRKDVMSIGIGRCFGVVVGSVSVSLNRRAEDRAGEVNGLSGERLASLTQSTFDTRPRL